MYRRLLSLIILALVGLWASLWIAHVPILTAVAQIPTTHETKTSIVEATQQDRQGRQLYETGQFTGAIQAWQQAVQAYQSQGEAIRQAGTLSNLALAYQKLGQWDEAERAIAASLSILQNQEDTKARLPVLAQTLNTQGLLQLAVGQPEQAFLTWKRAVEVYTQAEDGTGILRSQINQAQALQSLGLYRRALKLLTQVQPEIEAQPDSPLKTVGLRSLGNALRSLGDPIQSQQVLNQALAIAQSIDSQADIATALFELGKTAEANGDRQKALTYYQQAMAVSPSITTQLPIQLAQLSLLIDLGEWERVERLLSPIQSSLGQLPTSHAKIYAEINFAHSLARLQQLQATHPLPFLAPTNGTAITELLKGTVQQAQKLGDRPAESYGLGSLAEAYTRTQQWTIAQNLTEQALLLAQSIYAPEIAYRWQWQLGKILEAQGQKEKAILAYSEAIKTLQSIRSDLVTVNPEVQFSFRESVEPVYRESVNLLLQPDRQGDVSQKNLAQARDVIESLQLAELDNFFHEACLEAQPVQIDRVDQRAAVIYAIILSDRLEVILSLPQQPLRHYSHFIPAKELEKVIEQLRYTLVIRSKREFFPSAQKLYDWILRPAEEDLAQNGIKTLVFVLDGLLRNIPMAALHDGQHYLIEQYGIALTPGLHLLEPQSLQPMEAKTLALGLTQERDGFAPLNYILQELQAIQAKVPSTILLNEAFTQTALQKKVEFSPFPVVHIATHGQFSSNQDKTFILAWNGPINIRELRSLLQTNEASGKEALELLVLSACETAAGDKRAALGLAGMAVRTGARSTAATLWSVNDQATAELMGKFYEGLATQKMTKAEALRQAQLTLLKNRWYKHPFYWASYVLVGNWL
jgi:CHAT domain-containing protein